MKHLKKLLIGLTLLFSFIFVSNVSAANGSFTQNNYAIVNTYNATIEQVQDHLKNYPVLNNNSFISILQRARELIENNKISDYYMLLYRNESSPYALLIFFNEENVIRDNYTVFSKSIYGNYTTNFYFKTNTKITGYYVYSTSSKVSNSMDMGAATADGTSNLYYETNYSFDYHYSNNSAYDTFFANGIGYSNGDFVFNTMTGLNSIELGPKIYKFEDEIDTSNIDFIRFKLDVNDIIFNENFVQFNYSLNGNSLDKLFYPYIETLYDYYLTADDNETSTVLYKTYELSSYSNNIFENVNQDFNSTVYYNFVIDTRNFNDNLFLNFDSYYNYEVEIYNSDGTTEVLYNTGSTLASNDYLPSYNMVTVDLSDYSGIVLMPKVFSTTDNLGLIYNAIKYDRDYRIYLNGVYDIYIRSTPGNYLTLTDTFKSYSNPYFSKRFKYISFVDNKNTNLIRIVKSSSLNNNNFITFDSNMYSYSLISSSDEVVILPDANLPDNTINSGTIDEDVSLDEANNIFEDSELSITKFINDIDETLKYVHNVFNIFFNKLPILIQSLFIFVFNIVCIFMLLRMGGWLG